MKKRTTKHAYLNDMHRYDDIIDLPHHVSKTHPHMPVADRAAQFAPFAALSGHNEALKEAVHQVEQENLK